MTSAADLRELTDDDLRRRERELDEQIFRLRIQQTMGQLDAPHKVRALHRDLARVKTVLRERALAVEREAPGARPADSEG